MKIQNLVFILTTTLITANAHAISTKDLLAKCEAAGVESVVNQAIAYGCTVDPSTVYVQDVDNRWYNPSAYIWYQSDTKCGDQEKVVQMLQYSQGKCI